METISPLATLLDCVTCTPTIPPFQHVTILEASPSWNLAILSHTKLHWFLLKFVFGPPNFWNTQRGIHQGYTLNIYFEVRSEIIEQIYGHNRRLLFTRSRLTCSRTLVHYMVSVREEYSSILSRNKEIYPKVHSDALNYLFDCSRGGLVVPSISSKTWVFLAGNFSTKNLPCTGDISTAASQAILAL